MVESFILGAVQGIAEWLPVSSEAMVVLVKTNFFPNSLLTFSELISYAIFLHLGTLLAVCVWYHKKLFKLLKATFRYQQQDTETRRYLDFIFFTTVASGILGLMLIKVVEYYESLFQNTIIINSFVAVFLLITAILLYVGENKKEQRETKLSTRSAVITGVFQGLAAIPGISRSGSTVAGMGLLGIKKKKALELSFILSVPLVFCANIVLNVQEFFSFNFEKGIALGSAFVFGILTIALLLKIVEKIRFSYFVGGFACILILLTFVIS